MISATGKSDEIDSSVKSELTVPISVMQHTSPQPHYPAITHQPLVQNHPLLQNQPLVETANEIIQRMRGINHKPPPIVRLENFKPLQELEPTGNKFDEV